MAAAVDYVQAALASTRRAFVTASPFTFIVSDGTLPRGSGPHRTVPIEKVDVLSTQDAPPVEKHGAGRAFIAFALRKVTETFPQMITLGRTANNDLVVPDASISKLHAIFTQSSRGFEVADAGSKNGTFVAGVAVQPRGGSKAIKPGDRLRFGRIEFTVVDAGACWDTIDRMKR